MAACGAPLAVGGVDQPCPARYSVWCVDASRTPTVTGHHAKTATNFGDCEASARPAASMSAPVQDAVSPVQGATVHSTVHVRSNIPVASTSSGACVTLAGPVTSISAPVQGAAKYRLSACYGACACPRSQQHSTSSCLHKLRCLCDTCWTSGKHFCSGAGCCAVQAIRVLRCMRLSTLTATFYQQLPPQAPVLV